MGTDGGIEIQPGVIHWPGRLDRPAQESLRDELRAVAAAAPFFVPRMPRSGKPFSVRMTNCGELGWVSDQRGYRYQPYHPETAAPWPPIPCVLLGLWEACTGYPAPPQACLINLYEAGARMGLHQDRDEQNLDAPVLSVSLGDTAIFRIGGVTRGGTTRSVKLQSGDVLVFGGPSRLAFHGIDRVVPDSSTLLAKGGRINLTLRRIDPP